MQPLSPATRLPSHVNFRLAFSLLLLAAMAVALGLTACMPVQQPAMPDEPAGVIITLLPPEAGASTLSVSIKDPMGAPITDAQVSLEGNMNHAGMVPVMSDPVADDADGTADGIYQVPFEFTMLGDWIITVSVLTADNKAASADIDVTVGEAGAQLSGAAQSGLQITDVRARPLPMARGNTAVFLTIANHGEQPERLVNAISDAADVVELHETVKDGDVMRMVHMPEGFEIAPGASLELKPGGKHVMLMGVTAPMAVGDEIQVELVFEHSDPIILIVPVVEMAMPMP